MSDFSDRPFVAGTLTGLRSFRVDSLGRLTGVVQREVFRPGENIGRCHGAYGVILGQLRADVARFAAAYGTTLLAGSRSLPTSVDVENEKPHQVGQLNCGCGYYAYFDEGDNPHHEDGNVLAVVEGYGVTTVGSRGFRAEKARLVGLIEPGRRGLPLDGLAKRVDDTDAGAWLVGGGLAAVVGGLACVTDIASNAWYWLALLFPILGLLAVYLSFRGICVEPRADVPFDLVRRNYPDVPVYRSVRAALKAHPLTPPPPPRLPAPDTDEDFWTRSAS